MFCSAQLSLQRSFSSGGIADVLQTMVTAGGWDNFIETLVHLRDLQTKKKIPLTLFGILGFVPIIEMSQLTQT